MNSNTFIPDMSKLDPFDGKNYKMWSDKMEFFLSQIGVDYCLTKDSAPENSGKDFEKDNKTCRGMLLHYMTSALYLIYSKSLKAKEIWDALKTKYGSDDYGTKKYACSRWLNFRMSDDKPVLQQVHEYEYLCADIIAEGMKICEMFQANCLLEKLPPSWQTYVHSMKHKQKDFTLQELVSHIKIEEQNRIQTNETTLGHSSFTSNLVELKDAGRTKGPKGKGPNQFHGTKMKNKNFKGRRQFKGNCFTCGKFGHAAKECRQGKGPGSKTKEDKSQTQANLTEEIIATVVSEVNLVSNISEWVVDTSATRHICLNKDMFQDYDKASDGECVFMGNSSTVSILGKGKVSLKLTSGKTIALHNVLHVPDIRRNLISGALLNKAGIKLTFESDKLVLTKNGDFVGKGFCNGGLFVLDILTDNKIATASAYIAESVTLWHARLGHVNVASVKRLKQLRLIPEFSNTSFDKCEVCVEAKHPKKAFNKIGNRSSTLLELIHSDLGDFKNTMSRGGKRYYITFVDDFSRFTKLYLLSSKDEAEEKFLIYKAEVENQLNKNIKRLRTDRGGEYDGASLKKFCELNGIIHEVTAPYTPEQNGVAERKNRTLKDMMNAMLISSGMPSNMWGEAILYACYVLNRVPHKKSDKTPYELWKGFAPNLSYLKVWGCLGKIGLPDFQRSKIGPKTVDGIFVGFNGGAYRLILKDASGFGPFKESRDVEFFEHIFPMKANVQSCLASGSSSSVSHHNITSTDANHEPRRSKRARVETSFGPDFLTTFLTEKEFVGEQEINVFILEEDPKTYEEAMRSIDSNFWREAINSEIESIMNNNTWVLCDLPRGCKALGSRWIFKKKYKSDGSIEKYKARLVVGGHRQKKGVDFFDTYSSVANISTIRALIALASIHNLIVHQMDVKTAFLNGDLNEEIYMKQPEGCVVPGYEDKVCRLIRSLYGLRQAPKDWYEKFHQTIISDGFQVNDSDACVYSKFDQFGCVIICLYVDDMLIFGTNIDVVNTSKAFLSSCFDMKDLGEADVILGIKITRNSYGLSLNQSHYVEKILKKFNQFDCTPVKTPYDPSIHLKKNKGHSVSQEEYAKIIGSVMFLMNHTRPDIAYAVSRLSRYTHNPNRDHWGALIRLLKYLKGTINWGLHYQRSRHVLEGYCDANWVSDNDEIQSTSGYVFTLAGAAISWKSSKQTCHAKSTQESEFIALELAGQEAEWLRCLLADIPLWGKPAPSVSMHCDSQAAMGLANNQLYNGKKRHIRLRHAIIRSLIRNNVISLEYVKSERNIADPLTKGLCRKLVLESAQGMGLKPIVE